MLRRFSAIALLILVVGCGSTSTGSTTKGGSPDYDKGKQHKAVQVKQTNRGAQITTDERILFDTGMSSIRDDGKVFLDRVATILKNKTKADVAIEGHTDNIGTAKLNKQLSDRRAKAVMQELIARGVAKGRLQASGFGLTKPVADNNTLDGRQANRRVEIIVMNESVDAIGGVSLGDRLAEGLDRFLANASSFIKNVFGSDTKD